MKKILCAIDEHLEAVLSVTFTAAFVCISLAQVIIRFTPLSVPWTEELARYLFVWTCFMGIPWGVKLMVHMRVDMIYGKLPKKIQKYHDIISYVLILIFSCPLIYYSFVVVERQLMLGQRMIGLPIPMAYVYLAMPVAFTLVAFRSIQRIVMFIRTPIPAGKKEAKG